ncbi:cytochrome P450 [Stipitochalara longipes BDJ]|nr:cytochrome P450 [Stipitochalara longipes BDJ]
MTDSMNLLREGFSKFKDQPFQVWTTEGNQVVIPPKFIDELKMLPDHILYTSTLEFFQGKHSTFGSPNRGSLIRVGEILKNLSRNMAMIFPGVKDEVEFATPLEFPPVVDWTPIKLYPKVARLIARTSGRTFSGKSLCRNEEWLQLNCDYTRNGFQAALELRKWRPLLRSVAKYFIPQVQRLWAVNTKAMLLLRPIVQQRELDEKIDGYEKPMDTIEWTRALLPKREKKDYLKITILQLSTGAAAIHTTAQLLTNVLFDLAARPKYIELLREEAQNVLTQNGSEWTLESMSQLKKMDSFMKESQRHFTATVITFQRKTLRAITLSDGTYLPANTYLFSPATAISADPSVYENPNEFDGLRFYKKRQHNPEDDMKYQLISTANTQMHFGIGRHACPGRWFASYEIKLILITLMSKFDIKLKQGEGRPKNFVFQTMNSPNPAAEILFRSRDI